MNKQKILLYTTIGLFLTPILFYIYSFSNLEISDDPEKWGPFGDFFGGILNTYLSLLALIVTIFIAIEISKLDDKRNENVLNFERKRFLNELRESEYRRISLELQKVSYLMTQQNIANDIFQINLLFNHFTMSNGHLFPFLNEKVSNDVLKSLVELYSFFNDKEKREKEEKEGKDKFHYFQNYIEAVSRFSTRIQEFIISEL